MEASVIVARLVVVEVTFFGTRGSCPCSGKEYARFGGNTSCVLVDDGGETPLILDAGTGLRALGAWMMPQLKAHGRPLHATVLLTHLHYDHLLGLPFFAPLNDPGAVLEVFGPDQEMRSLAEVIDDVVKPPFFPVQIADFRGEVILGDVGEEPRSFGRARVSSARVPHTDSTLGYRIDVDGASVVYIPDHQAPLDREWIDEKVLELCAGADLLIHDAQYDEAEFAAKSDWGHSTVAYAVHVAAAAGVKSLALFHHDPTHGDDQLAELEELARDLPGAESLGSIFAAPEGVTITLGG
jgi:phosphoribosyl 1,2-cyclic phosphodiesterase